uniref:Nucleolar protein 8 n=1 Tax=Acrobeloides nanus TaxID=290746 RepID=A0A914DJP2_9BILA
LPADKMDELKERKSNKHEESQKRRLESLREKRTFELQRQKMISESLKSVDSVSKKNKIVFHSDSDEDEKEPIPTTSNKSNLKLFDDDDGAVEDPESFTTRFNGKSGHKLMKMEQSFDHDERFRVDQRFLDDNESDSSENEEQAKMTTEKNKEFAILSKVLGKQIESSISEDSKKKANKAAPVCPFRRFDPANPEHMAWLRSTQKKDELEKETESDEDETKPEINGKVIPDSTTFYEIKREFAQDLKKKLAGEVRNQDEGFSFLRMIGREPCTTSSTSKDDQFDSPVQPLKKKLKHDPMESNTATPLLSSDVISTSLKPWFFLTADDQELKDLVTNFKRTQSLDKISARWKKAREEFIKTYKKQRKVKLRELRKAEVEQFQHGAFPKNNFTKKS